MEGITLRELCETDLSAINCWRNDRKPLPRSGPLFGSLISRRMKLGSRSTSGIAGIRFAAVFSSKGMKRRSDSSVSRDNSTHRNAELHLLIGRKERRGRGIGTPRSKRWCATLSTTSICSVSRSGFLRTIRPCYVPVKRAGFAGRGFSVRHASRKALTKMSS